MKLLKQENEPVPALCAGQPQDESGHADHFWSFALAIEAAGKYYPMENDDEI